VAYKLADACMAVVEGIEAVMPLGVAKPPHLDRRCRLSVAAPTRCALTGGACCAGQNSAVLRRKLQHAANLHNHWS